VTSSTIAAPSYDDVRLWPRVWRPSQPFFSPLSFVLSFMLAAVIRVSS
jgi:hypothetical protein